jgi:hypothetical protein
MKRSRVHPLCLLLLPLVLLVGAGPSQVVRGDDAEAISVLLIDTHGLPIQGVALTLVRIADAGARAQAGVALTGGDGRGSLAVSEPGKYEVSAFLEGFLPTTIGPLPVTAEDRGSTRLVLPLVVTLNPLVRY